MSSSGGPESRVDSVGASASPIRAYVGLSILGWGLAILLQVAPHEDPVVGAGLAVFGAALFGTAPRKPHVERLPRLLVGAGGLAAAGTVLAYDAWTGSPLDAPKAAILVLGLVLAVLAPFLGQNVRVPFLRKKRLPLATLVACLLPAVAVPLLVWGAQAVWKRLLGTTPIEAFIHVGLLWPISGLLALFGWHPNVTGQTLQYSTPRGPLSVEVGAACSGVEAMGLFGGVLALYLLVERPRGSRMATWTLIGLLGVYVANLVRLTALTLVGYAWGVDALLQAHAQAGWVFFVAWAILFVWMARRGGRRHPGLGQAETPRAVPDASHDSVPTPAANLGTTGREAAQRIPPIPAFRKPG